VEIVRDKKKFQKFTKVETPAFPVQGSKLTDRRHESLGGGTYNAPVIPDGVFDASGLVRKCRRRHAVFCSQSVNTNLLAKKCVYHNSAMSMRKNLRTSDGFLKFSISM
jgi:hypothetical protein